VNACPLVTDRLKARYFKLAARENRAWCPDPQLVATLDFLQQQIRGLENETPPQPKTVATLSL
jgi:hypothetical protein